MSAFARRALACSLLLFASAFSAPAEEISQGSASVVLYKSNQASPASSSSTAPQTYFEEQKSVYSQADSSYNKHKAYGGNDHSAYNRLENGPSTAYDSFVYPAESPTVAYDTANEGASKYKHEADDKPELGVQYGEYNNPEHNGYDKPKYEHDTTHNEPQYGTHDEPKHEHDTYNEPKHEYDTYEKPKYELAPEHEYDTYDKPKYNQNEEHNNGNPKYDDSEYQPPTSDKQYVPALHDGPDPLDQIAPYLEPPSNSPAYHSYHSTICKQAVLDGIAAELKQAKVIPDILPTTFVPEFELSITFDGLRRPIDMGQLLSINDTHEEPIIEFDAPPGNMFTVAIVDIDSPSNSRHGYRSYRHFLMSNLGLYDDYRGEKLTAYRAPQPSFASGAHRLAVVVLKQTAYVGFTPQDVPHSRVRFDAVKWGARYHMTPVAASYFMVQRKHVMDPV
ncbi:hypothetical protein EV180_000675 [Coemansia sp. RSA 518]|nr:hypothetical protein IW144_000967 [Coemansia sp. RSA 522]KAJ2230959.1 hypothetical protein EV180_000675 [Coemansia sp. RSA 518]KAJ2593263.1 hypothetical protein IWW49_000597 [Coemansia sp. RSA 1797]